MIPISRHPGENLCGSLQCILPSLIAAQTDRFKAVKRSTAKKHEGAQGVDAFKNDKGKEVN